jgi:hypothetical protein
VGGREIPNSTGVIICALTKIDDHSSQGFCRTY